MKECFLKANFRALMEFLSLLMGHTKEGPSKNPRWMEKDVLSMLKELLNMKENGYIINLMVKVLKHIKMEVNLVVGLKKGSSMALIVHLLGRMEKSIKVHLLMVIWKVRGS